MSATRKRRKWPPPEGEHARKLAEAIATLRHGLALVEELLVVPERELLRQIPGATKAAERHWIAHDLAGIAYALPMSLDMLDCVLPVGVTQMADQLECLLEGGVGKLPQRVHARMGRAARRAGDGAKAEAE